MKMAIASKGREITSEVDERFGRAEFFLITDDSGNEIEEVIENSAKNNATGAGTGSAAMIADKGVKILVAGRLGPKAEEVIKSAGIKFLSFAGKVFEAIKLASSKDAMDNYSFNTQEEFQGGYGSGRQRVRNPESGCMGRGGGRGKGGGFCGNGRGQGRGRGMGRNCNNKQNSGRP